MALELQDWRVKPKPSWNRWDIEVTVGNADSKDIYRDRSLNQKIKSQLFGRYQEKI